MLRIDKIIALAILLGLTCPASAGSCSFSKIAINPISPENHTVFSGQSDFVEIRFNNEKDDADVSVFPEPPLTIINKKLGTECNIEGGVWVRGSVFISGDTSTLATQEFSGSNDSLIFYSTATCKKISAIDISNSSWELKDSTLKIIRSKTSGAATTRYAMDSQCRPKKLKPSN